MHPEDLVHIYKQVPFFPKRRLYRKAVMLAEKNRASRRPHKIGRIPVHGQRGVKLKLDLNVWLQRECFYFNSFELHVFKFIQSVLSEGDIIIDVGANIGFSTAIASRLVGPRGHVFAFEPSSSFYDKLKQNVILNGANNVSTYKLAVGRDDSRQTLKSGDQSASIVFGDTNNEQLTLETVDSVTLDQIFIQYNVHVKLLKIDVDGWDYNVLLGASRLLLEQRPIVIVEVIDRGITQPSSIFSYLREHGYEIFSEQNTSDPLSASDFDKLLTKLHGLNIICQPQS